MVISLERGADLHTAQLMPLPRTVSCYSKIQIGFTFLVPAHPGSPGKKAVKQVCVHVCVCLYRMLSHRPPPLLVFSLENRPALFPGRMSQNVRGCHLSVYRVSYSPSQAGSQERISLITVMFCFY